MVTLKEINKQYQVAEKFRYSGFLVREYNEEKAKLDSLIEEFAKQGTKVEFYRDSYIVERQRSELTGLLKLQRKCLPHSSKIGWSWDGLEMVNYVLASYEAKKSLEFLSKTFLLKGELELVCVEDEIGYSLALLYKKI